MGVLDVIWHVAPHLMRFPNGESLQDLLARTSDALRSVIARHPADPVVLVGHDSVNRALLLQLLDVPVGVVADPDRLVGLSTLKLR